MATEPDPKAKKYLDRYRELDSEKKPWLIHFQALAEIFLTRKMDFTRVIIPGQFLQADVYDNTAQFAAYLFSSIVLSMMWPDAARTIRLKPARRLRGLPGMEEYFRFVNETMHEIMDRPKAGLSMALQEHFLDIGIFGTSGVAAFENPDGENDAATPVVYDAWGVKNMCIVETAQGYVNEIYYLRPLTVFQLVTEYSKPGDSIPPRVMDLYRKGKYTDKIDVLHVIEPKTPEKGKLGIAGMAVRTMHIDYENGHVLREGGYEEMPVAVGRMFKSLDEVLGRSCGMLALPDAQSLNAMTEAMLVAAEKQLDPPLIVYDAGRLGGGVVDTSASAINVYDTNGRMGNQKAIEPIMTVGEQQSAEKLQESLKQKIMQAFFLDRLLDLSNNVQMTAYETSVRDKMRGEALGGLFSRQEKEVLTPTVHRTFNIVFRKGYLGIINDGIGGRLRALWNKVTGGDKMIVPDAVLQAYKLGLDVYEVEYISPAKRFQEAQKLQGLMSSAETITNFAAVQPAVLDNIDPDKFTHKVFELNGAPMDILRTKDEVLKFRAAQAKERMDQQKAAQAEQIANVALKGAQAKQASANTPLNGAPTNG